MLACRPYPLIFLCFEKYRYLTPSFKRPGFQEMLADIEAGLVGMVVVKDMSRFGRNYLEVGLYTEIRFPEMGVRFIAVNDGVDSEDQSSNDFTPFRNIIKNLCCLRGGIYKRPSDSTKVLDAVAYCFYSTRPTKR